jgi:hypothetical protein
MGAALFALPLDAILRPIGPISDADGNRLYAIQGSFRTRRMALVVGDRDKDWEANKGAAPPPGTFSLVREQDGGILALSNLGIYRLEGDPLEADEPMRVMGMEVPLTGSSPFVPATQDEELIFLQPVSAAMNQDTGVLAVYHRGVISLLARADDGKYEVVRERRLEDNDGQAALLAFGGSTLLAAQVDGTILLLEADDLKERKRFAAESTSPARFVSMAPQGRWAALVCHDRRLLLVDTGQDRLIPAKVAGQGDISAATFSGPSRLMVADRLTRVTDYDLETGEVQRRFVPKPGAFERVYRLVIRPLYTVFPKPGELDRTIRYLLSGEEIEAADQQREDPTAVRRQLRPWAPVWSSLAFAAVVLVLGCLYVQRQEF